jgi:hypothetical protein
MLRHELQEQLYSEETIKDKTSMALWHNPLIKIALIKDYDNRKKTDGMFLIII